jgi:hypothetical protein
VSEPVRRFSATVTPQGALLHSEPIKWAIMLSRLKGKRVWVSVTPEKQLRNLSQNAYLWVIYEAIAEWSGHESEEIHEAMKGMFLPKRPLGMPGDKPALTAIGSTTTLTVPEFSEYVDKVKRWAASQGCVVPEIGEIECRP